MKLITELGYMGFEVSDLPLWDRFAADVLGLGVQAGPRAGTRWLRMDEAPHRFILTEGPADDCAFAGWRVPDVAALEAFGQHLQGQGVSWAWASDDELGLRAVHRMLHFKDPVGNRHEVFCGTTMASTPFVSPRVAGGFVTGAGGLGHVVYSSSDYGQSVAFGQQVLGMLPSDTILGSPAPGVSFEVSFMHTNERHHSFAVAPQPPFPGDHKRIHHFMIEVASVEQVGFGRDRCLAAGHAVTMDIGQHPNDRMISYYGQTPSGFFFEFGWGGVKVDDTTWQVGRYDKFSDWGHRPVAA